MTNEEKLKQIRENLLAQAEDINQFLNQKFEIPKPVVAVKIDEVVIEWDEFETDKPTDLQFYASEIHDEWEHSIQKYVHLHEDPFDPSTGVRTIAQNNPNPSEYTWHARLVVDGEVGEEASGVYEEEPQYKCVPFGYWDPHKIDTGMPISCQKAWNGYKAYEHLKTYDHCIISISHVLKADETEEQWKAHLRGFKDGIQKCDPDKVPYVLLWDEPYNQGNFTKDQIERITELAREIVDIDTGSETGATWIKL